MYTAEYNKITGILTIKHKQDGNTSTMCFKTNEVKGIVYTDKYNKFMKGPISHLENTNYNKYKD